MSAYEFLQVAGSVVPNVTGNSANGREGKEALDRVARHWLDLEKTD